MATTLQTDLLDIAWFIRPHGQDDPCCGDLSAAEVRALATTVVSDCCTVQDIAHSLGVTRSGATRVVDRLEKRELANRCCSSVDRRCTCVELTDAGRAALHGAASCFGAVLDAVLAPLSANDRQQLESSLATFAALIRDDQKLKGTS